MPIDPKKAKKAPSKKLKNSKLPKLPNGANIKVIQITPRTFLIPLFLILLFSSLIWVWNGYVGEKVHYNDNIGLNTILSGYASGTYEEIVVQGDTIEAKKKAIQNVVNNEIVSTRDVDRTILPANLSIGEIGLSDPKNPTKVSIKKE